MLRSTVERKQADAMIQVIARCQRMIEAVSSVSKMQVEQMEREWREERKRYDRLIERMFAPTSAEYRVNGAGSETPTVELKEPLTEPLHPEVEAAIDQRVPEAGPLREEMRSFAAMRLRQLNGDHKAVRDEILAGANLDEL